ncbi:Acyl-CoA synthetase family member 2, mitochondrial [Mizuhopecten yessoensis]|uniref:Acyl-CoA synthetase family member 2, mitochondrial n=2 Tax=Mizuhopecten yessoensis TaxID=6573 RepID=A0A210PVN5_MIZYE|nr:Acyl-CoA synthetase family member 2, mitochondrial [Mizuhopecten yessoensis]
MDGNFDTNEGASVISRECTPAEHPLTQSYYHGICPSPLTNQSLFAGLEAAAKEAPSDQVALKVPEFRQEYTLKYILERANTIAKSLVEIGLKRGDVVMLNGVGDGEYITLYYATVSLGLQFYVPTMRYPFEKFFPVSLKTNPSVIFVGSLVIPEVKVLLNDLVVKNSDIRPSSLIGVVSLEGKCDFGYISYADFLVSGVAVLDETLSTLRSLVSCEESAIILTTSGTTGDVKFVCRNQFYMVNFARFYNRRNPRNLPEVAGVRNPVTDDAMCVIKCTEVVYKWRTMHVVFVPSDVDFYMSDISCLMRCIEQERLTWYSGYPYEIIKMLDAPDLNRYDISSLRAVVVTGQSVSSSNLNRICEHFPDTMIAYGSTEVQATMTSKLYSTPEQQRNSVGFPLPHMELKIVGKCGETLAVDEIGEVCVRGWASFLCYFNDPATTAAVKGNSNWIQMGDVGVMDKTGHVKLLGRMAECVTFKHMGEKVFPQLILDTARSHPKVKTAIVIGIPDDRLGDDVCLFVEPTEAAILTEEEIESYFYAKLMFLQCPLYYFVLEKLPRIGARLKVHIAKLREIATERIATNNKEGQWNR